MTHPAQEKAPAGRRKEEIYYPSTHLALHGEVVVRDGQLALQQPLSCHLLDVIHLQTYMNTHAHVAETYLLAWYACSVTKAKLMPAGC
jgi:hypothetical protein